MDIEKLKKLVRDNPVQAAAGALAVLLVAGVVAFTIYLNGQGNNKGFAVEGSRLIVVKDGMTTADIAELLHEKKLVKIPPPLKWRRAGRDWLLSCRQVLTRLTAA